MMLLANILLALTWLVLVGPFTISGFLVGMVLGFGALVVAAPEGRRYAERTGSAIALGLFFAWALFEANIRVAIAVVRSPRLLSPRVLEVPLEPLGDVELAILASLVTLTPGTVSLDVSADRRTLVVHVLHADDADVAIRQIKEGFEARLLRVTRRDPPRRRGGARC